ncbi:MAG: hypothetical protein ACLQNE_13065 [Thermoguttaceae bacterium]
MSLRLSRTLLAAATLALAVSPGAADSARPLSALSRMPVKEITVGKSTSTEIQRRLEDGARTYSHFATGDIVYNRRTSPGRWPPALYEEQARLLIDLRAWAKHAEAVRSLISHADAKVRTLALGVLFVHEDPQDLPLIASLVDDKMPTILNIHDSSSSQGGVRPLREIEKPQTVGDVAQSMLLFYLQAARLERGSRFADYWLPRQGRKTCASWFIVRFRRATRQTTPLRPEYHEDVKRVLSEINVLPPGERAWTQLYVFCDGPLTDLESLFPEAACVASLQAVGPDQILQFLQRKRVTQDPDLWFDEDDRVRVFSFMTHFVLRHAPELLRAQDAPVLLECEKDPLRSSNGVSQGTFPAWAAAAAELTGQNDPAAAKAIIDAALLRFPLKGIRGGEEQAVLIRALFRFAGVTEKQRIIDWFYQAQAKATREKQDWSNHGSVAFLRQVREAKRSDARPLFAAIVADPRFDQTDYWTLEALLKLANADSTEPLVGIREISDAWPPRLRPDQEATQAKWRDILRRHYAN